MRESVVVGCSGEAFPCPNDALQSAGDPKDTHGAWIWADRAEMGLGADDGSGSGTSDGRTMAIDRTDDCQHFLPKVSSA